MNQGKKATNQGKKFEDIIASQLDIAGATYERQVKLLGGSIFGKNKVIDFRVTNFHKYPQGLYLELKWQDSPGTVEEKMPYTIQCIKDRYDLPTMLILGGQGLTEGCLAWTLAQKGDNLVDILLEQDVTRWIMRNGFIR